jgi:hypothetical protein
MKKHLGQPMYYFAFPGAVLRAIWHKLICRLFNVPINEEQVLNLGRYTSYVIHEKNTNVLFNITITFLPPILNSVIGITLLIPVMIEYGIFNLLEVFTENSVIPFDGTMWANPFEYVVLFIACWFGFSIIMYSLPNGRAVNKSINLAKNGTKTITNDIPFLGSPFVANTSFVAAIYFVIIMVSIPIIFKYLIF